MKTFKEYITEVTIPLKELVIITSSNPNEFDDYFEPQGGGGGWDPFEDTIASKKADQFESKNKIKGGYNIHPYHFLLPKSKDAAKILEKYRVNGNITITHSNGDEILSDLQEKFSTFCLIRPTEKYKLIIDEAAYAALPQNCIGVSEYDYSFHAGEGVVSSWIFAMADSEEAAESLARRALSKVKVEYVGSSTELKFKQKYAVGRE
jgi:hypothetical protein